MWYLKLEDINEKYLPAFGEGKNMAQQIVTAINKLVYKWFNDGDVYDNTFTLQGWANDLSSYANWLHKHLPTAREILDRIETITGAEYENLLKDLSDKFLNEEVLKKYSCRKKVGSIYKCDGKFRFIIN